MGITGLLPCVKANISSTHVGTLRVVRQRSVSLYRDNFIWELCAHIKCAIQFYLMLDYHDHHTQSSYSNRPLDFVHNYTRCENSPDEELLWMATPGYTSQLTVVQ